MVAMKPKKPVITPTQHDPNRYDVTINDVCIGQLINYDNIGPVPAYSAGPFKLALWRYDAMVGERHIGGFWPSFRSSKDAVKALMFNRDRVLKRQEADKAETKKMLDKRAQKMREAKVAKKAQ